MSRLLRKLSEVCDIVMGQAPAGETYNLEGKGLPLVAGAGDFGAHQPDPKKYTTSPTKVSEAGDIILSIRATIGTKVIGDRPYCLGRGVAGLRAKRTLDQSYLWHWLSHSKQTLASKGRGATFPQVSRKDIEELTLFLPPLDEQRQIAAILDKADALRQKRKKAISLLNSLTQSLFLEMFGNPIANERRYPTIELDRLVDPHRGISYGIVQRGADQDHGVRVLRIRDIVDGFVDENNLITTDKRIADQFRRTKLKGNEIVISIRGTVGRCAIVPESLLGGNVSREIAVIPTTNTKYNPFYQTLLRTEQVQYRLRQDVKGVAQSGINLEDLRKLEIIQPPREEVERFLDVNFKLGCLIKNARVHRVKADLFFSSLQHRAFTGQL